MNLYQKKHDWILGGFEFLYADTIVEANPGTGGADFAVDKIGSVNWPYAKAVFGASGTTTPVSAANPLPVVQTGTPALPTGAATQATLAALAGQLPSVLGQTTMAGSMSIAIASNQSSVPINDASGSVTTDFIGQQTADYDTGAGTVTQLIVGIALPASGGPVAGGTATNPIRTDTTGATTQPVSVASLPLPTGAAAETTLAAASAKLPATLGQKAMTASMAVVLASDQASVPVAATLAAETTKVIGTINVAAAQTIATTNAGTFAVQDSEKIVDNAVFTDGSTKLMPIGHVFDDVAGTALTENDLAAPRIDSKRAVVYALEDATTRGQRQAVNAGGAAEVQGDVAHGASVGGNPVLQGYEGRSTDGTAVTSGQVVRPMATVLGKQINLPYCIPGQAWKYVGAAGGLVTTGAITIKAAAGAGIVNYITSILLVNSHQTIGTEVVINDGAAGTAIFRTWCQFAGGGCLMKCDPPLASTANTLLEIKEITATGTAGVVAEIIGYSAAE